MMNGILPCLILGIAVIALSGEIAGSENNPSSIQMIFSSQAGDRLTEKTPIPFGEKVQKDLPVITINEKQKYQTIAGFGATLLEAGHQTLNKIDPAEQEKVLQAVFDPEKGSGFSVMSMAIGACDMNSAGPWYTYDDVPGDMELKHFTIERDMKPDGTMTFIKRAKKYGSFLLEARADYPPDWMLIDPVNLKNQDVKPECYDVMARYFIKYLQTYAANGVTVDYLSPFNEPQYVYCKITFSEIRDFIRDHLGPQLAKTGLKTKLQTSDAHSRETGLKHFPEILNDPKAKKYIDSMAVHGYGWQEQGSSAMSKLHEMYPDIPIWETEVCTFVMAPSSDLNQKPQKNPYPIYEFADGDFWGRMIVADMQNWASAWMYWNLILDQNGGPPLVDPQHKNPAFNVQHPVIIINTETKKVTYTGCFYYLSHFSKYVRPGAVRIDSIGKIDKLNFVAFQGKDGKKILQVVNSGDQDTSFNLQYNNKLATVSAPAMGIGTYIWE